MSTQGRDGMIQRWPYCVKCWQECQSNGHEVEAALVALRYVAFLRFIGI
jgi:hypothetical protein